MNREQAIAELRKMYGKLAYWRVDEKAPTASEREKARKELPAAREAAEAAMKALGERQRAILAADPEWQRLRKLHVDSEAKKNKLRETLLWYRVSIGRQSTFANHITGQGDNWAEAIANAKSKK